VKLYLVRHAIAVPHFTVGYEDDSQRPLTDKGRAKMRDITRGLKVLGVAPQIILSSPYVRARQTAEILREGWRCRTLSSSQRTCCLLPIPTICGKN
jgi:phosphohistidine phosphatase